MDRRSRGLRFAPSDRFFGTTTGKRRDPDRFRDRILARAVERANANRQAAGQAPIPPITPHSLRRTWATFAAMIGRDPKWIAAEIGHTSPSFTFSVYQQVATRRYIDEQAIWSLMRFADEPAERAPSRQVSRVESDHPRGPLRSEPGDFDQALERLTGQPVAKRSPDARLGFSPVKRVADAARAPGGRRRVCTDVCQCHGRLRARAGGYHAVEAPLCRGWASAEVGKS